MSDTTINNKLVNHPDLCFDTFASKEINLQENENLQLILLQFDAEDYDTSITINLVGKNASVDIKCVAFASGGHKIENTVQVNHLAPGCKSNVLYKYALIDEDTRAKWVGNVKIDHNAIGTQTYEENRNLLLTRGAKAVSEPNLEILEGDILSAGHASATAKFDEEQLFYFQSRGIDQLTAKKLVIQGFFDNILLEAGLTEQQLGEIRAKIDAKIERLTNKEDK